MKEICISCGSVFSGEGVNHPRSGTMENMVCMVLFILSFNVKTRKHSYLPTLLNLMLLLQPK